MKNLDRSTPKTELAVRKDIPQDFVSSYDSQGCAAWAARSEGLSGPNIQDIVNGKRPNSEVVQKDLDQTEPIDPSNTSFVLASSMPEGSLAGQ